MATTAWERRPDESDPAFQAFTVYRDLGHQRSLAKVGRELGKSKTLMDRWSSAHNWVRRCAEWDAEQDRAWRQGLLHERRAMAQRQATISATAQGKFFEWLKNADPTKLTGAEAIRLFDVAARIEQAVLGNPTNVNVSQLDETHLDELSPEETLDRLRNLYSEIGEIVADESTNHTT